MGQKENHTTNESSALLKRIIENDEAAFSILFDMYYQKLFHLALYYLKSKELAEESVADVFYIIWKRRQTLGEVMDIEKYLYISVKNQCLHYIRRQVIPDHDPLSLYTIELIPDINNPESVLMDDEYRELVQNAIDSLPEKCREVFRLVIADNLKNREIAQLLDISEKTVEAHITSAYKRIALSVKKKYKN